MDCGSKAERLLVTHDLTVQRVPVEPVNDDLLGELGCTIGPRTVDDPSLNRAPGQMAFLWVHSMLEHTGQPFIATTRYRYRGARCDYLQRHPQSTLILVPSDGRPSVVFVAPDIAGEPDLDKVRALLLSGQNGIALNPGVWVRYAYPVLETADLVQVSSRLRPEDDIERVDLEASRSTVLEWYFAAPREPGVVLSPGGAVLSLPTPLDLA